MDWISFIRNHKKMRLFFSENPHTLFLFILHFFPMNNATICIYSNLSHLFLLFQFLLYCEVAAVHRSYWYRFWIRLSIFMCESLRFGDWFTCLFVWIWFCCNELEEMEETMLALALEGMKIVKSKTGEMRTMTNYTRHTS